jgi:MFS family permease
LFAGWSLFVVSYNLILTILNTLVADQVPEKQRGTVSGIAALSTPVGIIGGGILILATSPTISYISMIVIMLVVLIPYTLFLRDKVLPRAYKAPFNLASLLKTFWVNPRRYPDFGWAWLARALTTLGYYMAPSLLYYYLQEAVHYPQKQLSQGVATVQITSTLVMLVVVTIGGILSDRFQRRKIFVIVASVIIALGLLLQGLFPIWTMVLIAISLVGLGFGIYIPVDLALITQVLPSANDRGKDLGVINIANMLPQSLAPLIAAFIITQFHSYTVLFTVAALVTLLSGIVIQPIKSVR